MRRLFCLTLAVFLIVVYSPANAMDISAASAVVIEAETGAVVYAKDAYTRRTMASTTKIMTAICALEKGNLDKKIKIPSEAVGVEGSSIYLRNGENLSLRELVYGLMLNSGNDAAVAIAHHVSGGVEEFARLMNSTADRIGVVNTQFRNPNGLDEDGHYTTAFDLGEITAYAMKNEEFRKIVSTYQTTIAGAEEGTPRYLTNHNKLLKRMDGCIGVKTGFTKKSGRCLVSAAQRNGVTLVAVTLNAPDDWNDHEKLMDYGFERVTMKQLAGKNEFLQTAAVVGGERKSVDVVCKDGFFVPAVEGKCYVSRYKAVKNIQAPIGAGDKVGEISFYLDGKCIGAADAVAEEGVGVDKTRCFGKSIVKILEIFNL